MNGLLSMIGMQTELEYQMGVPGIILLVLTKR